MIPRHPMRLSCQAAWGSFSVATGRRRFRRSAGRWSGSGGGSRAGPHTPPTPWSPSAIQTTSSLNSSGDRPSRDQAFTARPVRTSRPWRSTACQRSGSAKPLRRIAHRATMKCPLQAAGGAEPVPRVGLDGGDGVRTGSAAGREDHGERSCDAHERTLGRPGRGIPRGHSDHEAAR